MFGKGRWVGGWGRTRESEKQKFNKPVAYNHREGHIMITSRVSRLSSWEIIIRCPAVLDVFICEGEVNGNFAPIQHVGKGPTVVDEGTAWPPYKESMGRPWSKRRGSG